MNEYETIVDKIRNILAAEGDPNRDALEKVEAEYVGVLNEFNGRIRKCHDMLQRNRSQALRMCDAEPPLTDVVGILEFPERGPWADYIKQFNLPAPPDLQIDLAGELNEAYVAEKSVANLMRLHRLYALGRVPLSFRIEVLRKIAAIDKGTTYWEDDLRTFEKARHDELQKEVAAAIKQNDIAALAALEEELCEGTWRIKPPKVMVDKVIQARTRLLSEQLTAAHMSLDLDQARELRGCWNQLIAVANLPPDDPVLELVAPALEWLANEDRKAAQEAQYAADLAALEQALKNERTLTGLESAYRQLARHGPEVPEALTEELARRIDELTRRDARRSRQIVAGVIAGVLLLSGLIAWAILHQMRTRELAGYVANLERLIADEKLVEAEQYLAGIQQAAPRVFEQPPVQKLRGDLQNALTQEQARQAQWRQALEVARKAVENPRWEDLPAAFEELKRAGGLAKKGDEQTQVQQMERLVRQKQAALQTAVDDAFRARLGEFKQQVGKLSEDDLERNAVLQQDAIALQQAPRVTAEIKAQVNPLLARLRAIEVAHIGAKNEAAATQQVTKSVGNASYFRTSLESYVNAFPGTKRANDFSRVLKKEPEVWKGVEAWDAFVRRWGAMDIARVEPQGVPALLADAAAIRDKHKDHPAEVNLDPLLVYLQTIAKRVDDSGASIAAKLNEPLNNPTVTGLYMVMTKVEEDRPDGGKRYYAQEPPQLSSNSWSIRFLRDTTLVKKGVKLIPQDRIGNRSGVKGFDWIAPQSAFSQRALILLDKLNGGNWDKTFNDLIADLYNDKRMEPLLKLQLLALVLEVARAGSLPLETAYAKHVELINSAQLDPSLNWLDPEDSEANKFRPKAESLLLRMENPQDSAAFAAKLVADLKKSLYRPERQWIAWLQRDRDGQWTCTASTRSPRTWEKSAGDLTIIDVPADGMPARFVKIGVLREGKLTLTAPPATSLVEGRPVYLSVTN